MKHIAEQFILASTLLGETESRGGTGPHGLGLASYDRPVFDGPQPDDPPVSVPNNLKLNTENAGE